MTNLKRGSETQLHFSPETGGMLTGFREQVLIDIYDVAAGLCGDKLKAADVMVSDTPGEEDSLILDLSLLVDADWDLIGKWRDGVLERLCEWFSEWPQELRDDYARRIYFGFVPVDL